MRKHFYTKLGTFGIEIGTKFRAIGIGFDIGGYEGDDIILAIHLGIGIYLSYSSRAVYKLTKAISNLVGKKYARPYNTSIDLNFEYWALSIKLFADHVGDDALWSYYLNIPRALKGNSKVTRTIIKQYTIDIVMPEKRYPATYRIEEMLFKYPRWPSRKRTIIDFEIPEGIPHEGKGENSYDCGMDYTYGSSRTYKGSLRGAADELAISILKERQRHSSLDNYLNVPSGRPPENVEQPLADSAA